MKSAYGLCVVVFLSWALGCASAPRAPRSADGNAIEVHVLSNRGSPDEMDARAYRHRNEVGQWMERDLLNQLRRSGYVAGQISSRDEFQPGPGIYLLEVQIDSYHAGSSAARIMVGYGAGSAALEKSYALYGEEEQPLLEWSDGVGTSQDWRRLPRRLNQNAVRRVNAYLREKR